jgi:hypothetical protein
MFAGLSQLARSAPNMNDEPELPPANNSKRGLYNILLSNGLTPLIGNFINEAKIDQDWLDTYDDRIFKRVQKQTVQDGDTR